MTRTYVGKVLGTDVEGGGLTFVTDQGVVFQLKGGGADLRKDGVRAEVTGTIAEDQVGLAMVGDVLVVKSYRVLPG